jgi:A/G-specific adenine glycosylase
MRGSGARGYNNGSFPAGKASKLDLILRNPYDLLRWYDGNRRQLPWRGLGDPYAIWVSEAMLQQTQIATALSYWRRWMERFPTVETLARASVEEVLAQWQGLGYYRRARKLREGAAWVVRHGWPASAAEWRQVPGVGPYTAAAIASIALDEPAPLVDGNVRRVVARLIASEATGGALEREAWAWAERNLVRERPGDWNQALMELGALVCRPRNPNCAACPLASDCQGRAAGVAAALPLRPARQEIVRVPHEAFVPLCGRRFGLAKIDAGEWWEGMWEFPRRLEAPYDVVAPLPAVRYAVTHHRAELRARLVRVQAPLNELGWFPREDLPELPLPSPQRKLLRAALALLDFE